MTDNIKLAKVYRDIHPRGMPIDFESMTHEEYHRHIGEERGFNDRIRRLKERTMSDFHANPCTFKPGPGFIKGVGVGKDRLCFLLSSPHYGSFSIPRVSRDSSGSYQVLLMIDDSGETMSPGPTFQYCLYMGKPLSLRDAQLKSSVPQIEGRNQLFDYTFKGTPGTLVVPYEQEKPCVKRQGNLEETLTTIPIEVVNFPLD